MAKFGKWVGLGLGWALGGPLGGILGLAVGSIFDTGTSAAPGPVRSARSQTLRGDYAASLLVLIAAVMKADGRVM
jgi:DnaJ like chaperone protein